MPFSASVLFLWRIAFPCMEPRSKASSLFRLLLTVFITLWSLPYFLMSVHALGQAPGVFHNVHLVFHEAGHTITAMLTSNRDLIVFMGSGAQVLMPLVLVVAFLRKGEGLGAALCLWWVAHAALDVAPYIGDARMLQLQLLTGGTGSEVEGHDWEYLLTSWNMLNRDVYIAHYLAITSKVLMGLSLAWAFATVYHDYGYLRHAGAAGPGPGKDAA